MKLLTKSVKNSYFIIGIIALVFQNIAIFFQHYFSDADSNNYHNFCFKERPNKLRIINLNSS